MRSSWRVGVWLAVVVALLGGGQLVVARDDPPLDPADASHIALGADLGALDLSIGIPAPGDPPAGDMELVPPAPRSALDVTGPGSLVFAPRPSTGADYLVRRFELRPLAWGQLYPRDHKLPPVAADPPTDPWGIPMRRWVDGRLYYSPSAITFQALRRLNAFIRTRKAAYLDIVLRMADRLTQLMVPSGGALWLPFPYDDRNQGLHAPWYNALAQGTALALFSRLHRLLGEQRFLDTAHGLFRSFLTLGPSPGPWVARVDADGYLWLEHYPGGLRGKVLNAHVYGLFGLRDYWQELAPDDERKPLARRVLEGAITTMRDRVERFRRPGKISWYNLRNRVAHRVYHGFHISQLRALATAVGDPWFDDFATVLAGDYP
jgi:hypothetical protein